MLFIPNSVICLVKASKDKEILFSKNKSIKFEIYLE